MVEGIALLLLAQLLGECLRQTFALPVPGPVIGMFLVAVVLIVRRRFRPSGDPASRMSIEKSADSLIAQMGLLFVPAGVGIIALGPMLKGALVPLVVSLVLSTLLALALTGGVMHAMTRRNAGSTASIIPVEEEA